jgi:hypothetical protein
MPNEGRVDERRDGVRGEREHGGCGDGEDVRRYPVNPEPPLSTTPRDGLLLFLSLNPSPWLLIGCRLVDDVCDDRLPTTTSASRGTTPPRRSRAAAVAAAGGQGDTAGPRGQGSCVRGGCRPRRRRRGRRHGRASEWSRWSECDWLDWTRRGPAFWARWTVGSGGSMGFRPLQPNLPPGQFHNLSSASPLKSKKKNEYI